jgi:hypothetical protein
MRRTAVVLALVVLAACGKGSPGGDHATVDSGIRGKVVIGPTCPVETAEMRCRDRPYEADLEVVDGSGDVVAGVHSAKDGTFRVSVPPGTYTLRSASGAGALPFLKDVKVVVHAHAFTRTTVAFDSGIR